MKLTYRSIAYDKNPTATVASSPLILGYRGVPYLKNWWVKCILRYISQERGGGTNHKDTKDTKIDQS